MCAQQAEAMPSSCVAVTCQIFCAVKTFGMFEGRSSVQPVDAELVVRLSKYKNFQNRSAQPTVCNICRSSSPYCCLNWDIDSWTGLPGTEGLLHFNNHQLRLSLQLHHVILTQQDFCCCCNGCLFAAVKGLDCQSWCLAA